MNQAIKLSAQGFKYRADKKPNAFLEPENANAVFNQRVPPQIRDFRSVGNPFSGSEMRHQFRKSKPKDLISVTNYDMNPELRAEEKSQQQEQTVEEKQMLRKLLDLKIHDTVNK